MDGRANLVSNYRRSGPCVMGPSLVEWMISYRGRGVRAGEELSAQFGRNRQLLAVAGIPDNRHRASAPGPEHARRGASRGAARQATRVDVGHRGDVEVPQPLGLLDVPLGPPRDGEGPLPPVAVRRLRREPLVGGRPDGPHRRHRVPETRHELSQVRLATSPRALTAAGPTGYRAV